LWLSCVRRLNATVSIRVGNIQLDVDDSRTEINSQSTTSIAYWRSQKNLSNDSNPAKDLSSRPNDKGETQASSEFMAAGGGQNISNYETHSPETNIFDQDQSEFMPETETVQLATETVQLACWTDRAFGQLNNFFISTLHALLAARAANRMLAVRDRIPCEFGEGVVVLADLLDVAALRATVGHRSVAIINPTLYTAACSDAPVAPLDKLPDFAAHRAVRIEAGDAFNYRRDSAAALRRAFAGVRFPARIRRLAADYVAATFGAAPFAAVHLRTCSDIVDYCSRFLDPACPPTPARIDHYTWSRIRSAASELRRGDGAPVPAAEAEAAVAPLCWPDPAGVAAQAALRLPPPPTLSTHGGGGVSGGAVAAAAGPRLFVMDDGLNASLTARSPSRPPHSILGEGCARAHLPSRVA
jgi:hypothetical protein